MAQLLRRTKFGHPVLRAVARRLTPEEIVSAPIQELITNMRYTLDKKKMGVGLAAPQVGQGIALAIIGIKTTPLRPNRAPFERVIINPEIVATYGPRVSLWEGCISSGAGPDTLYGKALRYKKIKLRWLDEKAEQHEEILEGFPAHVAQHETDHLNGVLFVDHVRDTKTYMLASEYRKYMAKQSTSKRGKK